MLMLLSRGIRQKPHRFLIRGQAVVLKHAQHDVAAQRVEVITHCVVVNLPQTHEKREVCHEIKFAAAGEARHSGRGIDVIVTMNLVVQRASG